MKRLRDVIAEAYDPGCQISPSQVEVIAAVLRSRAPGARMLVFGLGRDTPLWRRINEDGETVFVEHDPAFIDAAKAADASVAVVAFDFGAHTSVLGSFATTPAEIARVEMPPRIAGTPWDVVLVDGPPGYHLGDPGRLLPIHWTSRLMRPDTHVFVDDYNRPVERHFADLMLRFDNAPCAVLAHEREAGKTMLWRIGLSGSAPGRGTS